LVESDTQLPQALLRAASPDLLLDKPDAEIGFIHRRARISPTTRADYYFIVNTGQEQKNFQASFRVGPRKPQLWDLEHGAAAEPAVYLVQGERTVLDLSLGPRRSVTVYFGASQEPPRVTATNLKAAVIETGMVSGVVTKPGTYFVQTASRRLEQTVSSIPDSLPVAGPWKLEFGSPLNLSATVSILKSWTEEPKSQYFSGRGTYSTEVTIPRSYLGQGKVVWLDLGDVRYAARLWVNGQPAGDAWQPPYRLEISRWLKPGGNALKIEVANLLINCLLGQKPPEYSKLKAAFGDRFPYPQDWKNNPNPWPAGLLGPVRLVSGVRLRFALDSPAAGGNRAAP
jgi:hypothetical protein